METKRILFALFFLIYNVIIAQVNITIPTDNTGQEGDTILVPINVSDLTGESVFSYQLTVEYDSTVAEAIDVETEGTLSDDSHWMVIPNVNNKGEIIIAAAGSTELSGSGVLIYMKYVLVGEAGSSTSLSFSEMMFNSGNPSANTTEGLIIISEATNTTSSQSILLNQGWNMVSSYINPDTTDITLMMQPIIDHLIIMKNGDGKVFIPAYGIDNIHNWNYTEGYKLYLDSSDTLVINGQKLNPAETPIILSEGWNMFAYLLDSNKAVNECMSSIVDNLVIVKDINGKVYIPAYGINTIGNMAVGSGYKAYMNTLDTLIYGNSKDKETGFSKYFGKKDYSSVTHYPIIANTSGSDMTIILNATGCEDNSEICVKDLNTGLIVGSGKIIGGKTVISVLGDNQVTENIEGARNGTHLGFYFWDKQTNNEFRLEKFTVRDLIGNSNQKGIGEVLYSEDGLYLVTVDNEIKVTRFELKQNYPNPFNPSTVINYSIPFRTHVSLKVYNSLGQEVVTLVNGVKNAGNYSTNFIAKDLSSGIYYYSLIAGKYTSVKKMILLK